MTIAIACSLQDAVVLVADGRGRKYDVPGHPLHRDDADKITKIGETLAIMTMGVSQVTDVALKHVEYNYQPHHTLPEIISLLDFSLEAAWSRYYPAIPPGIDVNHPYFNGTLVIGGINSNSQFIASVARHYDGRSPKTIATNIGQAITACADQNAAGDFFDAQLTEEIRIAGNPVTASEQIDPVIKSGAKTVRFMQEKDRYIGGVIRYAVIQRGLPFIKRRYEIES